MSEKGGENCSVKSVGMSSREMGGCSPPAAGSILRLVTGGRRLQTERSRSVGELAGRPVFDREAVQLDTAALDEHGSDR